jgi:hypothetical protein
MLAALTGCSSTVEPATSSTITTTTTILTFDLTDPATQRSLGSPEPDGIVWQRFAGEVTIVGLTAEAVPQEIDLVAAAFSDLPAGLLAAAEPRLLVRTAQAGGAEELAGAVTVSYGPDVYLLDRTFSNGDDPTTRLDLAYALAHELVHVAQWFSLEDAYVGRALAGDVSSIQLTAGSVLVRDYAAAVGWTDSSTNPDAPSWELGRGEPPTPYGLTNPAEDLADSVALAVTGRANWLDEARLDWIITWLDASEEDLSAGLPWVPVGAEAIVSATTLFDERLTGELAAERNADHIEALSYLLTAPDAAGTVGELESELRRRGLQGNLTPMEGSSFPRFHGTFARPDGVVFLVELWETTGGEDESEVVVTYVSIW